MNTIKLIRKEVADYIDVEYFIKFVILFSCLYYFNLFFVGITQTGGLYFPFIAKHFNYVSGIQSSVINAANLIAHSIGISSYINSSFTIYNPDGSGVNMGWACAGLGVMSFWLAFVVSDKIDLKNKVIWALSGLFAIWIINCLRITLLLVALYSNWEDVHYIDHHQMFNILSYIVIGGMILFYQKQNSKS
jgi:exosortase/archaeosortase family protein